MTISLCLLIRNELEGCKIDAPNLPRGAFEEVFAVDGGSTDGGADYLLSLGIPVYQQTHPGLNAAYWEGINIARGDAVVFFFPKGTLPCADLLAFRPLLEEGCQLVVASRSIAGAVNEEDTHWWRPRKWLVGALGRLAALVWRREGYRVRDVLHGVRAYTVTGFRAMNPADHGLSIDLEGVVGSYRLRLRRAEFPTTETARRFGGTHFKILPTGWQLLRCLWRELGRRGG